MLTCYQISDGRITEVPQNTSNASVFIYTNPEDEERRYLINTLKINEHTINSSLDPFEIGRLEFERDHMAIIIKQPKRYQNTDNFLFKISSIGAFLFPNRMLVIIQAGNSVIFQGRQFQQIRSLEDLLLKLMFTAILHFEGHLQVINTLSDDLEGKISTAMENQHLTNMFSLEKSLVYYLNSISSNGKVIEKFKASAAKVQLTQDNLEFIDDLIIENSQCYEQASIYSHVLSSLMDARASIVNNNLNLSMKTLTWIMLAIMVPNLVVSIFSVNVALPFRMQESILSFWLIFLLALFATIAVFYYWFHDTGKIGQRTRGWRRILQFFTPADRK